MAREFNVRTAAGTFLIADLHLTVTDTYQDLLSQPNKYTYSELMESNDLNAAIKNDSILVQNEESESIRSFAEVNVPSPATKALFVSVGSDQNDWDPSDGTTSLSDLLNSGVLEVDIFVDITGWTVDIRGLIAPNPPTPCIVNVYSMTDNSSRKLKWEKNHSSASPECRFNIRGDITGESQEMQGWKYHTGISRYIRRNAKH